MATNYSDKTVYQKLYEQDWAASLAASGDFFFERQKSDKAVKSPSDDTWGCEPMPSKQSLQKPVFVASGRRNLAAQDCACCGSMVRTNFGYLAWDPLDTAKKKIWLVVCQICKDNGIPLDRTVAPAPQQTLGVGEAEAVARQNYESNMRRETAYINAIAEHIYDKPPYLHASMESSTAREYRERLNAIQAESLEKKYRRRVLELMQENVVLKPDADNEHAKPLDDVQYDNFVKQELLSKQQNAVRDHANHLNALQSESLSALASMEAQGITPPRYIPIIPVPPDKTWGDWIGDWVEASSILNSEAPPVAETHAATPIQSRWLDASDGTGAGRPYVTYGIGVGDDVPHTQRLHRARRPKHCGWGRLPSSGRRP